MDDKDFREFGKAMVDYIADYTENIRDRDVLPNVKPGYLYNLLPKEAPEEPETWQEVFKDVEKYIMPGMTHWNSPNFHAYFPLGTSYPSIVGELLIAGLGCVGFSWISSPACTELEMITIDWLGKLLNLPEEFLHSSPGSGGGTIQSSASESMLLCLSAARELTINRVKNEHPKWSEGIIREKLVAYTSDQSNCSVEKIGRLGAMLMRHLPTDEYDSLRGNTLLEMVKKDIDAGLIPCYVVATLGTTPTCAFDNIEELGSICKKYNIWFHIDAAYAGAAFICPEFRDLMSGIQYADSFNLNPHKWLLVNIDCSALWLKDARYLTEAFNVERIYMPNEQGVMIPDFRHWQISLGRRFRALKLWFVLRLYGVKGLQKRVRHSIKLANRFEELVNDDNRFEVPVKPNMGLVCFRLKGDNNLTKQLHQLLMTRRQIYVIPGAYQETFVIRFVICTELTTEEDIIFAWNEICNQATEVLRSNSENTVKFKEFLSKKKCDEVLSRIQNFEVNRKRKVFDYKETVDNYKNQ